MVFNTMCLYCFQYAHGKTNMYECTNIGGLSYDDLDAELSSDDCNS